MKTHQEGNAIESDLFFIFIGFLTFGDFSHVKRKRAKRREHMPSAQIDVAKRNWTHMKITEKKPHANTYRKDTWTHNKGRTYQKGMKTNQKGNTSESDLSFIFIGFRTFGDFSHKKRQSAKRREQMSSAQIDVVRKNAAREHISKRHINTQQSENTSKRHENTPKGNTIESDLSFMFSGFRTIGDFSHVERQSAKRREHMSSAQIDVAKRNWTHMKITEKTPHANTYRKDTRTHNKGRTHQKGMKTNQKGNTIKSDLSFIFIGFLTFGDFSHNK